MIFFYYYFVIYLFLDLYCFLNRTKNSKLYCARIKIKNLLVYTFKFNCVNNFGLQEEEKKRQNLKQKRFFFKLLCSESFLCKIP